MQIQGLSKNDTSVALSFQTNNRVNHFVLFYYSIVYREDDPMVPTDDNRPRTRSILKQTNPMAGKRVRAPMIKQTVSTPEHHI